MMRAKLSIMSRARTSNGGKMKLPVVSGRDVIKALSKKGFVVKSVRGSHAKLIKNDRVVIVPLHSELSKGTLLAILRQAGISKREFIELLKDP